MSSSKPPLLMLAHRVPFPPDKGDRIRTYHLLRWLSTRAEVHLACLADEPVRPEQLRALERLCARVAVVPLGRTRWVRALSSLAAGGTISVGAFASPELRSLIESWAAETPFHRALASASSLVPYLQLPALRHVPAVVDLVDVDSQKWLDYATTAPAPKAWLYALEGRRLRRLERGLPGWAHAVTLVSEAEAELYRGFAGRDRVHAVVNGVDLDAFRPTPEPAGEGRGCVFVGALDYRPNVEGITEFCRAIWPAIRERSPGATLRIVGRNPVPRVARLSRLAGVEVVGSVPDVRPYLSEAALAVVPLSLARGVQNKVLESLASGRAVVASPDALTGLALTAGEEAVCCSSPAEWTDAVARLLADPDLRRRLGRAGRAYVESHHDWERCLAPFGALLGLETAVPAMAS